MYLFQVNCRGVQKIKETFGGIPNILNPNPAGADIPNTPIVSPAGASSPTTTLLYWIKPF